MRRRWSFWIFLLLVGLLAWMLIASSVKVNAQSTSPKDVCDEVEVVLLIDQSGSMGGVPIDHPIPNDPHGLRFYAPLHVIRWMGSDYLGASKLRLPSRPVVTYHVAVVDFGDETRTRLPWTTIAPTSDKDWQKQEQKLEKVFQSSHENLGNTNILAALREAAALFSQRADRQNDCPRRAIFLLSDGMPYVPPPEGSVGFSVVGHMEQVKRLVQGELKDMGVEVWVTALNDSNDNYWPRMKPYWEDILSQSTFGSQSHALKVDTEDEIAKRFTNIMRDLANRNIEPVHIGPRCVPPYLQQIIFTFYKQDPKKEHLQISDPVGLLTPNRTDVQVEVKGYDEPIEYLIVQRPIPGEWDIQTTAPRADVLIDEDTLPAVGSIHLASGNPKGVQYVRDGIILQLTDSNGNPLPEYTDKTFQLTLDSKVVTSQGESPLNFNQVNVQEYKTDVVPTESGLHQVVVTAHSKQPVQKEIPGSHCQWTSTILPKLDNAVVGEFDVAAVGLVRVGQPQINRSVAANCPLQAGDQMVLSYEAQRLDTGQAITLSLPVEWNARLQTPSGTRDLQVEGPDPSTNQWRLTLSFDDGGNHTLTAVAKVRDSDGRLHALGQDQQTFQVAPVQPISAEIHVLKPVDPPWWLSILQKVGLAPTDEDHQIGNDPRWRSLPMQVEVLLTADGQTTLDPNTVFTNPQGQAPVVLTVADAHGANAQQVTLAPTTDPGRYLATIQGLSLGTYELRAELAQGMEAACGFALTGPSTKQVKRIRNPWIYLELLLLALGIIVALLLWRRRQCQTRNPCQGVLSVIDKNSGRPVDGWYKDLSGRNRWSIKDATLAEKCQFEEIRVQCTRGKCGKDPYPEGRIYVEVVRMTAQGPDLISHELTINKWEGWPASADCAVVYVSDETKLRKIAPK